MEPIDDTPWWEMPEGAEPLRIELPAEFLAKSEEGRPPRRCLKGFASTCTEDQDGEEIVQKGIDFRPLLETGYINYDHQYREIAGVRMPVIIGYPTDGRMLTKGLWLEGELLSGDPMASEQLRLANEVWELGNALQKAGDKRRLAYSIEGYIPKDGRRGKKVVKSVVQHVAVTHKPVNVECSVELFAKSLCCGRCDPDHPQYNPAHRGCQNKAEHGFASLEAMGPALEKALSTTVGAALMRENLDRGFTSVLYGERTCGCFDPGTGLFWKGLSGAVDHMIQCQGYGAQETRSFLRRIIHAAPREAGLTALVKQAGLVRL